MRSKVLGNPLKAQFPVGLARMLNPQLIAEITQHALVGDSKNP
jgi:hypothetical protein